VKSVPDFVMPLNIAGLLGSVVLLAIISRPPMIAIVVLGLGGGLPYAGVFNRAAALFPGRSGPPWG
jgi:hypothetical protein